MKVNYLLKMMVAVMLMLVATTVKAADITVTGTDRAALVTALDAAQPGDVLLISQSIGIGEDQLTIAKHVTFKGVGDGIEIKAAEGYTMRVLQIQPGDTEGQKLIFENLTFTGANNQGNATGGEKDGGLGRTANGTIEFNNCKFINNYSADRGGVFDMYGGNVTFTDCEFTGNSANGRGGAIFTRGDATKATFVNCKFTGNHVNTGRGGALYLDNKSEQKLYNCILSENYAGQVTDETDYTKNTGEGGAVFTTGGEGVLYVENSTIVKNYTLKDHGAVLFAMSKPTITFVNTTIAGNTMYRPGNSMFFCIDALKLNLINVTFAGNNAYVNQEGDPTGKEGPDSGNTTGIRINNKDAKVKIYNSILAGNLSREAGGLVPVDIFLQENAANADNIAAIFEIKNSIVGNIKGLPKNALAVIPGIETSVYDFYPQAADWQDSDNKTGIVWANGLTTLANGQAYYPLTIGSKAAKFGDPALLAAYITPLVDQVGKARTGTNVSAGAVEFANTVELSLDDVITWDGPTYDAASRTITFNADWQGGAGWDVSGLDLSAYDQVTVEFENAQGGYVRITSEYSEGDWVDQGGANDPTSVTNPLDVTRIDKLTRIGLGVNNAGSGRQVVLKKAYFSKSGVVDGLAYSIEELNFFENSSYDADTYTATYNGNWQRVGWNFESQGGYDASDYNQVFLEFDASALPATNEGEHRAKIQFDVTYMDGSVEGPTTGGGFQGGNEYRASDTIVWWNLTKSTKLIKLITLKSEVAGDILLKNAYFYTKLADPVDLIVSEVRWEPVSPVPGDSITFFATIKNISEFASPAEEKHGVVFQANGSTVSWSDAFYGPLAAGDSIEVSSRQEGSTGPLWVLGTSQTYTIRGWVNDTKNIIESDYDNNYSAEYTLTNAGLPDLYIDTIRWSPKTIKEGTKVTFNARVGNKGTVDSPNKVKHGVPFFVDGNVVSWCDNDSASIAVGKNRVFTANGGPGGDAAWTVTLGTHTISAQIDDSGLITESDETNNSYTTPEKIILVVGLNEITVMGRVYIANGTLHISGYSPNAEVTVYNLQAQKVAGNHSGAQTVDVNLPAGAYIININDNGKLATHKVLVK